MLTFIVKTVNYTKQLKNGAYTKQ